MERRLVSIQTIDALSPIAGADKILAARVMGWTVVVKKDEFSVGDPCVFFEIDSVLPDGPAWSEFLRKHGFRVKTMKLRGVLSQGLALPVAILGGGELERDVDLRERLGVVKYEPVVPDAREIAGPFPSRVPKTDEIRLQSALGVLEELRGLPFYVATKCDGTSATFVKEGDALIVASRNWALAPGENHAWRIAAKYKLAELPDGIAIQGELCGPGIQKNRLGLAAVDLFVFSVHDTQRGGFLGYTELVAFCATHGLPTVPIERIVAGDEATAFPHSLEGWLAAARGVYPGTTNHKEGIVVRPLVEQASPTLGGGRLSFKVINNDYLLAED